MKKILKRVTAMCCATIMAASTMAIGTSAKNNDDTRSLSLNGKCAVTIRSVCDKYYAYGRTATSMSATSSVSSKYVYYNTVKKQAFIKKSSKGNDRHANTVKFYAPAGCRSLEISSSHHAAYNGETIGNKYTYAEC